MRHRSEFVRTTSGGVLEAGGSDVCRLLTLNTNPGLHLLSGGPPYNALYVTVTSHWVNHPKIRYTHLFRHCIDATHHF